MRKSSFSYNSYVIEGELYVNVSTILNVESGGELVKWALRSFTGLMDYQNFMTSVVEQGKWLHKVIECDLKGEPFPEEKDLADRFPKEVLDNLLLCVENWYRWKEGKKIKLIAAEQVGHSPKYRVAGQCDMVLEIDGKLFICDLKTGAVRDKAFTQVCAYKSFFVENPPDDRFKDIKNAMPTVIQLHRDGAPLQFYTIEDYYDGSVTEADQVGLFHALRYVWAKRNLKSRKWKPMIKNMEDLISPLAKEFYKQFEKNEIKKTKKRKRV